MKKFTLFLAAVLFGSSTAFADYIPIIRPVENGCPDLDTYIVGLIVDDQGGITSVSDLNIEDGVYQLTLMEIVPTPYENSYVQSILGDVALLDTCFLLDTLGSYGNGTDEAGGGYTESHDGSDPYNIVSAHELVTSAGIGDFKVGDYMTTAAIRNPPEGLNSVEFMQVVVPHGQTATLTGYYTNPWAALEQLSMVPFTIVVPEPSTLAFVVMAGLYLVGFRYRKNA